MTLTDKFCVNCKHHRKLPPLYFTDHCFFAAKKHPSVNPVSGQNNDFWTGVATCAFERTRVQGCGPEGKFFEPKAPTETATPLSTQTQRKSA